MNRQVSTKMAVSISSVPARGVDRRSVATLRGRRPRGSGFRDEGRVGQGDAREGPRSGSSRAVGRGRHGVWDDEGLAGVAGGEATLVCYGGHLLKERLPRGPPEAGRQGSPKPLRGVLGASIGR